MKKNIVELTKTLLLVALTCSAIYLGYLANRYYDLKIPFVSELAAQTAAEPDADAVTEASRPLVMAVMNTFGRYGVAYDDAGITALYDSLGRYLGEALGTLGAEAQADDETVAAALSGISVYFEFPGDIPLSALAQWLGTGLPQEASDKSAGAFVIAAGENAALYYRSGGLWYGCGIDLRSELDADLESYRPNSAAFVYELAETNEAYKNVDGFCLVTNHPLLPQLEAETVIADRRAQAASALGFNPYSDSSYMEDDGTEIFTANNSMLKLAADGLLTYESPAGGKETPDAAHRIELARQMLEALADPGDAKLYFSGETVVGGAYILTFDYIVSGAAVMVHGDSAARVTIAQGGITDVALWLRKYTLLDTVFELLPPLQAAVITEGSLKAVYTDGGGAPTAGWQS